MSLPSAVPFDDIKLSLESKFQMCCYNNEIHGCSIIQPDKIVIANLGRSCVTILTDNDDIEEEIHVSPTPRDVTVIDNNTMAVSCYEGIKIINISTGKIEKSIHTRECTGVEYYNGALICCVPSEGVVSVDLKSYSLSTLVEDTGYYGNLYCTVYKDHIYISRYDHHTVTCYSMTGYELWESKDDSVILNPFGIAVDNSSNVYVASYGNNSVVVLSPDGNRRRTLLTEKDGISNPIPLHFNRSNNKLMVFNEKGPGFLYRL